jgi:hypothetical protein
MASSLSTPFNYLVPNHFDVLPAHAKQTRKTLTEKSALKHFPA